MINLYSLSYTINKNIVQADPVPDSDGWHCSMCGKPLESGYVCCLHDMGNDDISGEFCASKDECVPERMNNAQFKIDDLIFSAGIIVTRRIDVPDSQKLGIVSKHTPTMEDLVFYRFYASKLELEQ